MPFRIDVHADLVVSVVEFGGRDDERIEVKSMHMLCQCFSFSSMCVENVDFICIVYYLSKTFLYGCIQFILKAILIILLLDNLK